MKKFLLNFLLLFITVSASSQIIVSGEITTNTSWTNNNIYIISGWLYVRDGAVLTIEEGTIIKGDFTTKGTLIIERGAQLIAEGTPEQPIVFTSQKAPGERYYGDWGGVILCGRASINVPENIGNGTAAGENIIEGGVGSVYGGGANPNDDDNSGILRYVRIEYGGIAFQPNNEINGLTLGGVGRATIIDHVQVSYSGDDSFEWFGGTVNCTNLIAYRGWDDDFDTDFGYRGKIQWAMSVRDPAIADQSGSNGFESDNDGQGTGNTPITNAIFSNVTIVGPYAYNSDINSNYKRALHIRRNSRTSVFNSVFTGYPVGLLIDGTATQTNAQNNDLRFRNSCLVTMADTLATTTTANPNNVNSGFGIDGWYNGAGNNNSIITAMNELMLRDLNLENPDLTLLSGSPLESGANFSDSFLSDAFFTPTAYRGAFGESDWTACWAEYDPQNAAYSGAINNAITATITPSGNTTVCVGESVTLNATTVANDVTYTWSNGSIESSISVLAPATITLLVSTAKGCSAPIASIELNNYNIPQVSITADGPTSFCIGSSVTLTSTQSTGNTWSNESQSQSISVNSSGNYSTVYIDENGCNASSNIIEVSVSNSPIPTVGVSGETTICSGESVVLTASESDSYLWTLNGQNIPDANTQTMIATDAGAYSVTVTNTDACDGAGTSNFVFLQVNPTPTAAFDFDFNPGSADYEFNNNSINATTYHWDFGDGITSDIANPAHTFINGGTNVVTLTATNGDCSNELTITINSVGVSESRNVTECSIFPNPTNGDAILRVSLNNSADVNYTIYDITGKIVHSGFQKNTNGVNNITLPATEFSAGMYFVKLSIGNLQDTLRLVVKK